MLELENLEVTIARPGRSDVRPVRGVSLRVDARETLALVGESGCGKSMTCLAVSGLLPRRGFVSNGRIRFDGTDLTAVPTREAWRARAGIACVFQDATNALNPVRRVGWQIAEAVRLRAGATRREAAREAVRLLGSVGIADPERRAREYPHQFSGGMDQRAMIALAIAGGPRLLIADEATTALDVTLQAQIIELLTHLRDTLRMGLLLVTHDLALVAQCADRAAVMYAGSLVESRSVRGLFRHPLHPYARGLLEAIPRIDGPEELSSIPGTVPPIDAIPHGCAYTPRCPRATARCRSSTPRFDGQVACHHPSVRDARSPVPHDVPLCLS